MSLREGSIVNRYIPSITRRRILPGVARVAALALAAAAISGVVLAAPSLGGEPTGPELSKPGV